MGTRHLISTKPLLCRCKVCHSVIWYALDEGMPVYCDVDDLDLLEELHARLSGRMTFNLIPRTGLWARDEYGIKRVGTVLAEHAHRSGFYEIEWRKIKCQTETRKRETDSSLPPY